MGTENLNLLMSSFICHVDVIVFSIFHVRWEEEVVDQDKDQHARSTGAGSTAYKYHFLQRPIVNEYADLIWAILLRAGYQVTGKHKYNKTSLRTSRSTVKWPDGFIYSILTGDLISEKTRALFKIIFRVILIRLIKRDPFDTRWIAKTRRSSWH